MKHLTRKQAIMLAKSGVYKTWSVDQVARFQISQERLCMDFDFYHRALELALGRSVLTTEIADPDPIIAELDCEFGRLRLDELEGIETIVW